MGMCLGGWCPDHDPSNLLTHHAATNLHILPNWLIRNSGQTFRKEQPPIWERPIWRAYPRVSCARLDPIWQTTETPGCRFQSGAIRQSGSDCNQSGQIALARPVLSLSRPNRKSMSFCFGSVFQKRVPPEVKEPP